MQTEPLFVGRTVRVQSPERAANGEVGRVSGLLMEGAYVEVTHPDRTPRRLLYRREELAVIPLGRRR